MSDTSILGFFTPPGAVPGTGLLPLTKNATATFGTLSPILVAQVIPELPGIFGGYPDNSDITPSAILTAFYAALAFVYLFVFLKNWSAGHRFSATLCLALYAVAKAVGFGMRIKWAKDVLFVQIGLASVVFTLVPTLYVNVFIMYIANRVFTWRHPQAGKSLWFQVLSHTIYTLVLGIILMAILGTALPFLYFYDEEHLAMCQKVAKFAGICNILYACAGLIVLIMAYSFKPGTIDHRLWGVPPKSEEELPVTFQATWIEKFSLFYYPKKGSQRRLPEGAISVISSAGPVAYGYSRPANDLSTQHGNGTSMKTNVIIIIICSLLLTIDSSFRLPTLFILKPIGGGPNNVPFSSWVFRNYIYYIFYGGVEYIVNIILLVSRVDLRFYIPDRFGSERYTEVENNAEKTNNNGHDQSFEASDYHDQPK